MVYFGKWFGEWADVSEIILLYSFFRRSIRKSFFINQKSTAWCCCVRSVVTWPLVSITVYTPVRAAR